MTSKNIFLAVLYSLFFLSGCTQNISSFKGQYRNIQKYETYDTNATIYKEGSSNYNTGFQISLQDDHFTAMPVKIDNKGNAIKLQDKQALKLEQTDTEIFKYKVNGKSPVLTFIFSGDTLIIDEYIMNSEGNYIKESRRVLQKL